VRRFDEESLAPRFDESADDFLPSLLPFSDHPLFLRADPALQRKALTCAWLAYNEKTIAIETEIIGPLCTQLLSGRWKSDDDPVVRESASAALVDEGFHVLLTVKANAWTRHHRKISVEVPRSHLVTCMSEFQSRCDAEWQKGLVLLATGIVSEIFISDYLDLLSRPTTTLQPFNREVVDTHRHDEMVHSVTFRELAKCVFAKLSHVERAFLFEMLPRPVRWFAARDLKVWRSMLRQIDFPEVDAILADCVGANVDGLNLVDYGGVVALARELGATDRALGIDAFRREGLAVDP
jgi:hypothetical protein